LNRLDYLFAAYDQATTTDILPGCHRNMDIIEAVGTEGLLKYFSFVCSCKSPNISPLCSCTKQLT